jgi:hypothetical protein
MNGKFVLKKCKRIVILRIQGELGGGGVSYIMPFFRALFIYWLILNKNICLFICSVINQMIFKAWKP